jgi:hypothetical protein
MSNCIDRKGLIVMSAAPSSSAPAGLFTPWRPVAAALWSFWTEGRRVERVCYLIGGVLFLSGLFHLAVFAVDGGPWEGPVSWRKPTTFGLSFGLTLITIAWVASFLRLGGRARTALLSVFAAACVAETAMIGMQAWRHVPSHFDMETPLNTVISMLLAGGGGVLIVILVTLTVRAFGENPGVPASTRLALRAGFTTLLIALASGAIMIARGVVLVRTGHQQAAYAAGGFLKPVHAVTMHGILVLPGLAWLLSFKNTSESRRIRVIAWTTTAYAVAIAAVIVFSVTRSMA